MATSDSTENPVHVNVVPMVDVIFCLCVFFMCSFQLKRDEGRLDASLPKNLGNGDLVGHGPPEIRVALYWDANAAAVQRQFGSRFVPNLTALESLMASAHADAQLAGRSLPLVVDADARVPWDDVVAVVDRAVSLGLPSVQFAAAPPAIPIGRGR